MGAVAGGQWPSPRFPSPLIEPDVRRYRIRLSDWLHREAHDGAVNGRRKDSNGRAEHVLSAFCGDLQTVLGHEASRGKGLEIPDALKLLERLDVKGKIVTGDAIFCQKSITAKIVERGGDYVLPVKDNQKALRQDIETAFNEPVFPPHSL